MTSNGFMTTQKLFYRVIICNVRAICKYFFSKIKEKPVGIPN